VVCDVEQTFGIGDQERFDVIIFADILEHVRNREEIILRARRHLKPDGIIIASTGNVAHLWIRLSLLFGRFSYTEKGILDKTHVHLFTRRSFRRLFRDCALRRIKEEYCPIPFENIIPGWNKVSTIATELSMFFAWAWPTMFAYQFVLTLSPHEADPGLLLRAEHIMARYDD